MVCLLNLATFLLFPISSHLASVVAGGRQPRHAHSQGVSSVREYFGFPLGEDPPPEDDEFGFVGCFDSWNNNSRSDFPHFDTNYDPIQCSEYCKVLGLQVSLLKGGECVCKSFSSFKLNKVQAQKNCNVACPVSSLGPPATSVSSSCGGNMAYSVYCSDAIGTQPCSELPIGGSEPTRKTSSSPDALPKSLRQFCGRCSAGSCNILGRGRVTPTHDYFPINEPWDCRAFCGKPIHYAKTAGGGRLEELVRPPTKYAALLFDPINGRNNPHLPICACVADISDFERVDDLQCSATCPGDPAEDCGRTDPDLQDLQAFYATIHCSFPDCGDPPTTTMAPTTMTTLPVETTTPTPSTSTSLPPSSTQEITETTLEPGHDGGDCDGDYYSEDCSTSTDATSEPSSTSPPSPSTSPPEEATSTPTIPQDDPNHLNCGVMCSGTEFSGRFWSVCAGGRENKSCATSSSVGVAFWECSLAGEWTTAQPDYSECASTWLDDAIEERFTVNDTASALSYLSRLEGNISRSEGHPNYFGHEISALTIILDLVIHTVGQVPSNVTQFQSLAQKTVAISATLITTSAPWTQLSSQNRGVASTSLIQTVEETSLLLAGKMGDESTDVDIDATLSPLSNYFVVAGSVSQQKDNNSLDFPSGADFLPNSILKLPPGWQNLIPGQSTQYVGLLLSSEHANLLLPGQFAGLGTEQNSREKVILNGNLMSFTISGGKDGTRVKKSLSRPSLQFPKDGKGVEIIFQHDTAAWGRTRRNLRRKLHYGEDPKAVLGSGRCAYWDTEELIWSTKGCKMLSTSRSQTICECHHLTSFAVLMDIHNYLGKDLGLEILTILLCALSFLCLTIAILVFSTFHGIQSERNSITKNLATCLLIGNTLILLVLDRNYFDLSEGLCIASGILTHYAFLSAFAWMGVEGLHLYRMVVHVFDSENSPLNMYRVVAYGVPLILVILTTMIGYLQGDTPYGGEDVCWLTGGYIWSFLVPVVLIVVENLIILFIALKTAYQVQYSSQKKVPSFQNKMASFRIWLRGCLSLTILLGVTWILGFFALIPASPGLVAAYLFTILNASQGIFIFIFHCLVNDKVRHVTYKRFGSYLPSWISSSLRNSSSSSSTPSDGGKRADSGMKHSASDSSLRGPIITTNPETGQNKARFSPKMANSDKTESFALPGGISIIASGQDSVPQVVNRRGSLILRQWDSFGTVSSLDSVAGRGSGSLSDSSCTGGNSTDNSQRAMIR